MEAFFNFNVLALRWRVLLYLVVSVFDFESRESTLYEPSHPLVMMENLPILEMQLVTSLFEETMQLPVSRSEKPGPRNGSLGIPQPLPRGS